MLKLKLQYFSLLMRRTDSFKKTLMLGKIESRRRRRGWDGWMVSLTQWTWVWVNSRSWWWTGRPDVLQSMGSQRVRHNWATELNWTETRPPGSSIHGILQARILERVAISSSEDLPDPGMEPTSFAPPASQANSLLGSHRGSKLDRNVFLI